MAILNTPGGLTPRAQQLSKLADSLPKTIQQQTQLQLNTQPTQMQQAVQQAGTPMNKQQLQQVGAASAAQRGATQVQGAQQQVQANVNDFFREREDMRILENRIFLEEYGLTPDEVEEVMARQRVEAAVEALKDPKARIRTKKMALDRAISEATRDKAVIPVQISDMGATPGPRSQVVTELPSGGVPLQKGALRRAVSAEPTMRGRMGGAAAPDLSREERTQRAREIYDNLGEVTPQSLGKSFPATKERGKASIYDLAQSFGISPAAGAGKCYREKGDLIREILEKTGRA
jgi:hypothetical protein